MAFVPSRGLNCSLQIAAPNPWTGAKAPGSPAGSRAIMFTVSLKPKSQCPRRGSRCQGRLLKECFFKNRVAMVQRGKKRQYQNFSMLPEPKRVQQWGAEDLLHSFRPELSATCLKSRAAAPLRSYRVPLDVPLQVGPACLQEAFVKPPPRPPGFHEAARLPRRSGPKRFPISRWVGRALKSPASPGWLLSPVGPGLGSDATLFRILPALMLSLNSSV